MFDIVLVISDFLKLFFYEAKIYLFLVVLSIKCFLLWKTKKSFYFCTTCYLAIDVIHGRLALNCCVIIHNY